MDSWVIDDEVLDEDLLDHVEDIEGKLGPGPLWSGRRVVWVHVDFVSVVELDVSCQA